MELQRNIVTKNEMTFDGCIYISGHKVTFFQIMFKKKDKCIFHVKVHYIDNDYKKDLKYEEPLPTFIL